jgi:RNA polymerase sigma-70 factor (ECF subfamily)
MLEPDRLAQHLPRLTRMAIGLCRSREAGEDLVQDTLERVLRAPRRVSGDEFPYLARALRNTHIDRARSAACRPVSTPLPQAFDDVVAAPDHTASAAHAREILAAVAELPEPYRDAVLAVDVAGYAYAEAAELLGIPVGTVMSRLYRGRQRVIHAVAGQ